MAISKHLLVEFNESLRKKLVQKFQKDDPQLEDRIIRAYLDRFKEIKRNLDKRDIMQYSWSELESTIDGYQSKKDFSKKGVSLEKKQKDANLLYDKNGITIFIGKDKDSCIRYSAGYSFCIGSNSPDKNLYSYYRKKRGGGTPYFLFNTNLPRTDDYHVVVLFSFSDGEFTITNAPNREDKLYKDFESLKSDLKKHWGMNVDFLDDIISTIPLGIKDLYEDFEDKGTHYEISSANLSGMSLKELPNIYAMDH